MIVDSLGRDVGRRHMPAFICIVAVSLALLAACGYVEYRDAPHRRLERAGWTDARIEFVRRGPGLRAELGEAARLCRSSTGTDATGELCKIVLLVDARIRRAETEDLYAGVAEASAHLVRRPEIVK